MLQDSTEFGTSVVDDGLSAATSVPVSLRVTDAAGTVLFDAAGTAALQEVDVNGGGCGPIVFTAEVTARADGTLS